MVAAGHWTYSCLPLQTSVTLFDFFYKQSGSRRTLRALLYFICFTFNVIHQGPLNNKHRSLYVLSYILSASRLIVIHQGPLNNKHRSLYAISYILSASRLMLSVKAHLTLNTDHCVQLVILESKTLFFLVFFFFLKFGRAILSVFTTKGTA